MANLIRIWSGAVPTWMVCALEYGKDECCQDWSEEDRKTYDAFVGFIGGLEGLVFDWKNEEKGANVSGRGNWYFMDYIDRCYCDVTNVTVYRDMSHVSDLTEKMKSIVDRTMSLFESDFYRYDTGVVCRNALQNDFIWQIDTSHTYIVRMSHDKDCDRLMNDPAELDRWCKGESWGSAILDSFTGSRYWLWNHTLRTFTRITLKHARQIWNDYQNSLVDETIRMKKIA